MSEQRFLDIYAKAKAEGDADTAVKALEGLKKYRDSQQSFLGAAKETGAAMAQNVLAQGASGLTGLSKLATSGGDIDAANKAVQDSMYALSTQSNQQQPSARSQGQMQDVGQFMQNYVEPTVRQPVSGLVGLGELGMGQGLDQAAQSVQNVQQQGYGQTVGNRILEETGSPALATVGYTSGDLIPYAAAGKAITKGVDLAAQGAQGLNKGFQVGRDIIETMPARPESLKNAEVRKGIEQGSKYFIDKKIDPKTGRIIDNPLVKKARLQQISDESIAQTIRMDKGTKRQAKRILDRGADILEFSEKDLGRPNAIIGERVMKRFDTVLDANLKAGRDISNSVKTIENQSFDVPDLVDNWEDSLASLNITRDSKTGRLNFKGSAVEKDAVAPIIQMMDGRLKAGYKAKELHAEKQFIAKKLYNSQGEAKVKGGSLDAQGVKALEQLRDGMNQKLRDASPEYKDANDRYSETITTINDFQKVMGGKNFNPYSDRIDDTAGNEIRKVLTQYRSGQDMQEAIKNLNEVSTKYGGKYDDDIIELARFYDNFEREFKSFAQGSFPAQTRDAMKETAAGVAVDAARGNYYQAGKNAVQEGIKAVKGQPTERAKIKALRELLEQE